MYSRISEQTHELGQPRHSPSWTTKVPSHREAGIGPAGLCPMPLPISKLPASVLPLSKAFGSNRTQSWGIHSYPWGYQSQVLFQGILSFPSTHTQSFILACRLKALQIGLFSGEDTGKEGFPSALGVISPTLTPHYFLRKGTEHVALLRVTTWVVYKETHLPLGIFSNEHLQVTPLRTGSQGSTKNCPHWGLGYRHKGVVGWKACSAAPPGLDSAAQPCGLCEHTN